MTVRCVDRGVKKIAEYFNSIICVNYNFIYTKKSVIPRTTALGCIVHRKRWAQNVLQISNKQKLASPGRMIWEQGTLRAK
jgi:hypothetical protein